MFSRCSHPVNIKVKNQKCEKRLKTPKNIEQKQKKTKRRKKQENAGGTSNTIRVGDVSQNKACVRLDFRVEGFKFLVLGFRFLVVINLGSWRKRFKVLGFGSKFYVSKHESWGWEFSIFSSNFCGFQRLNFKRFRLLVFGLFFFLGSLLTRMSGKVEKGGGEKRSKFIVG